jgi:hypothetical protein
MTLNSSTNSILLKTKRMNLRTFSIHLKNLFCYLLNPSYLWENSIESLWDHIVREHNNQDSSSSSNPLINIMVGWLKLEDNIHSSQQKVVFWVEFDWRFSKVKLGFRFNCDWSYFLQAFVYRFGHNSR